MTSTSGPVEDAGIAPVEVWCGSTADRVSQVALVVKNPPVNPGDRRPLGREDPLEEGTATHSSIPAWRIPWTEEPGGLQSTVFQRVRHD